MKIPGVEKAIETLLEWVMYGDWATKYVQEAEAHYATVVNQTGLTVNEIADRIGDGFNMVNAFIIEDFLTARFGPKRERNVIDDFLRRRGWREEATARRYLEALRDSRASLYEVVEIDPGRSLTLRDMILDRGPIKVLDKLGSKGVVLWDRIGARVVPVDGANHFSGVSLRFSYEASRGVLGAVDELCRRARKDHRRRAGKRRSKSRAAPPLRRESIVRSLPCGKILSHCWILGVLESDSALPELRNTDDETVVICKLRFPITGAVAKITAALDSFDDFLRVDDDRDPHWSWIVAGSPMRRAARLPNRRPSVEPEVDDKFTSLGQVEIGAGTLILNTISRERAERGQALLERRLGDLLGRPLASYEDPYAAMDGLAEMDEDVLGPPEEGAEEAIHAAFDEHYRRTLDDPIPMLGGRTLRGLAASREGRKQAIEWLKQLENKEHRRAWKQGRKPYDASWIWRELGLERPR